MGVHDEAKLDVKFMDFAKQMNLHLSHFPKHEKYGLSQVIRNKAYEVYGFIVESQKRYQKRYSLHKVRRGLNFVGYRTWRSTRYLRKHSLYTFTQSACKGRLQSVISILGHARHTGSHAHLLKTLKGKHHDLFNRLPSRCRPGNHAQPQTA